MGRHQLPAFALPLSKRAWDQLRFDGTCWSLRQRRGPQDEQPLERVQVVFEGRGWRLLRLQWRADGDAPWRRWWPRETHLYLCERQLPSVWPLIGAALTACQGRPWLGR